MYVRREKDWDDGGLTGTMTSNPKRINRVVKRAWRKIYKGNVEDMRRRVRQVHDKYKV